MGFPHDPLPHFVDVGPVDEILLQQAPRECGFFLRKESWAPAFLQSRLRRGFKCCTGRGEVESCD